MERLMNIRWTLNFFEIIDFLSNWLMWGLRFTYVAWNDEENDKDKRQTTTSNDDNDDDEEKDGD